MRIVIMLAAVLVVSLLIFKSYPVSTAAKDEQAGAQFDPVDKAKAAEAVIQDAAKAKRQALENQLQQ